MWIFEVEDADSNVKEWAFDEYRLLDKFLVDYMLSLEIFKHNVTLMYANEDCQGIMTGELVEEAGEFFSEDAQELYANYVITRIK